MVAAACEGIPVVEITPQRAKASTGIGFRYGKEQVVKMMSKILKQKDPLHHHCCGRDCWYTSGTTVEGAAKGQKGASKICFYVFSL